MSVYKRPGRKYYEIRFAIGRVRVSRTSKTTSKREAEEYEEKLKKEIRAQLLLGKKPTKIWAEAGGRWLVEKAHKKSLNKDIYNLEWLSPYFDTLTLTNITKDVIEKVAKKREESADNATVNRMLALIKSILRKCIEWEWLDKVPHIRMRKENGSRIRWITHEEAGKLLEALPYPLNDMAAFALYTGLRQSNVLKLKWSFINLDKGHAWIPADETKNSKYYSVPLNQDAIKVLRNQLGKHLEFVFTQNGKPLKEINSRMWAKAIAEAGIKDFRWHDLRHTWASWHVQSGTTLQELYELGNWKSFNMVLVYAHLSSTHIKRAAENISGAKMAPCKLEVV